MKSGNSTRVYIAGPMRGLPMLNFPAFFSMEAEWRARGWDVVNPAQMDKDLGHDPCVDKHMEEHGLDFAECMARDLPAVASCDAIALMPGWERSVGANMELTHAIALGRAVYDAGTYSLVSWKPVLAV